MVEVQNLSKVYNNKKALNAISFSVAEQEILGFLGPNGAGKSTTMNIITGYISASAGTVRINGKDILEEPLACKKNIGYLPEHPPLYLDMTVKAYLSFIFDLKKIELPKKKHIAEVCEQTGIADITGRLINNLSKGFKQRVGIAQAILGRPALLILDEPTVGLDPKQRLDIRRLITEQLASYSTIIFSSHVLEEIQSTCERIIVINNGSLIADDTSANLTRDNNRIVCRVAGPVQAVRAALAALPAVKTVEDRGEKEPCVHEFLVESEKHADIRLSIFYLSAHNDWPLLSMEKQKTSLEDIFLKLVTGS
ncbi:MAG: ABC transporter ATP-binding protein [Spirochaetaceae bacterium]|jgi:ABC-2 type transport system ATP-binding protein|nr:ABC transporter ATP-binding protein [Spirochaetaceae bacterium]